MKKPQLVLSSIAALAILAATGAKAEDAGTYVGASVGAARLTEHGDRIDRALADQGLTASTSLKRNHAAYALTGGYQFNKYFALEGSAIDFGRYKFNSNVTAPAADTIDGRIKAYGVAVDAVGMIPLEYGFSVYGKAGVVWSKAKLEANSTGVVPVSDQSHSGVGPTVGLGVRYDITRNVSANLEWNHYNRIGSDRETGRTNFDLLTLGAAYHF